MARATSIVVLQPLKENALNDFNHIKLLVARVTRGRRNRKDTGLHRPFS